MSVFLVKPIFPVNCGNHPVLLRALSLNLGGDPTSWSLVSGVHINRPAPPPPPPHTHQGIHLSVPWKRHHQGDRRQLQMHSPESIALSPFCGSLRPVQQQSLSESFLPPLITPLGKQLYYSLTDPRGSSHCCTVLPPTAPPASRKQVQHLMVSTE